MISLSFLFPHLNLTLPLSTFTGALSLSISLTLHAALSLSPLSHLVSPLSFSKPHSAFTTRSTCREYLPMSSPPCSTLLTTIHDLNSFSGKVDANGNTPVAVQEPQDNEEFVWDHSKVQHFIGELYLILPRASLAQFADVVTVLGK